MPKATCAHDEPLGAPCASCTEEVRDYGLGECKNCAASKNGDAECRVCGEPG